MREGPHGVRADLLVKRYIDDKTTLALLVAILTGGGTMRVGCTLWPAISSWRCAGQIGNGNGKVRRTRAAVGSIDPTSPAAGVGVARSAPGPGPTNTEEQAAPWFDPSSSVEIKGAVRFGVDGPARAKGATIGGRERSFAGAVDHHLNIWRERREGVLVEAKGVPHGSLR